MIATIATWLVSKGVSEGLAKPLIYGVGGLLAAAILFGGYQAWKSGVINDWINKANVEFLEKKDEVTGQADSESSDRRDEFEANVKDEKEMIDEAVKSGCDPFDALAGKLCPSSETGNPPAE